MLKKLKNKIRCKLGFHSWKVIRSIRLSNIIFIVKKHNELLNKSHYNPDFDYIVYDRQCKICNKLDLNIENTKQLIIEKLKNNL